MSNIDYISLSDEVRHYVLEFLNFILIQHCPGHNVLLHLQTLVNDIW